MYSRISPERLLDIASGASQGLQRTLHQCLGLQYVAKMARQPGSRPDVAETSTAYMKTRDEVDGVVSDLHRQLRRESSGERSSLSALGLLTSRASTFKQASSSTSGVHRAYLKALQAHSAAQHRYDALKAELLQQSESTRPSLVESRSDASQLSDSYIPLLRQREKRRRFQILERAYSEVAETGNGFIDGHLDDIVKEQAGGLPIPPTSQASAFSEKLDVSESDGSMNLLLLRQTHAS